tara:strand:+ start:1375 stop:1686 length:312 start_codon:yes stop_codon:yes gene_type:complete
MNIQTMDLIEKMQVARLRKIALIEQYCNEQKISSELAGLSTYNPDHSNFRGIEYTQAQITSHWQARINAPMDFEFTLNNISNFLKGKRRECLDQIRHLITETI